MPNDNANKIKDLLKDTTPFVDYEKMKKAKDIDPAKASKIHAEMGRQSPTMKSLEKMASPFAPYKMGGKKKPPNS